MKLVVLELRDDRAAVLDEEGIVRIIKNRQYQIGQQLNLELASLVEPRTTVRNFLQKRLLPAAAAVAIVFAGGGLAAAKIPCSSVTVGASYTASVKYELNAFDKVLSVDAVSEESEGLAEELQETVTGESLSTALDTALEIMEDQGILDTDSETVSVIVDGPAALKKGLKKRVQKQVDGWKRKGTASSPGEVRIPDNDTGVSENINNDLGRDSDINSETDRDVMKNTHPDTNMDIVRDANGNTSSDIKGNSAGSTNEDTNSDVSGNSIRSMNGNTSSGANKNSAGNLNENAAEKSGKPEAHSNPDLSSKPVGEPSASENEWNSAANSDMGLSSNITVDDGQAHDDNFPSAGANSPAANGNSSAANGNSPVAGSNSPAATGSNSPYTRGNSPADMTGQQGKAPQ